MSTHVAIDLGAGSGRALVGRVGDGRIDLHEVHRFRYEPRLDRGHLRWNTADLFHGLTTGLRHAQAFSSSITSIGVDSWGVDYALLDADGRLLEEPICYRDSRTDAIAAQVFARVPREELFARTGIQFLKFNTLFQLFAHAHGQAEAQAQGNALDRAAHLLMMPDLCHHFLCGALAGERTNASTTQLLNATTGDWDDDLFARLDLPRALMPPLIDAGCDLGALSAMPGDDVRVIAPATHDTGSAVLGTPLERGWAYISSGTWSLIGVELDTPRLDPAVARANFTNERGAFGTVRFLKNVMGLWLLESCRKEWAAASTIDDLPTLLARVAALPGVAGRIFPDDARFFNPVSMTSEFQALSDDPVMIAKIILDSLALRYASILDTIETLTGAPIPGIHIVGGGCLNEYLNQATANAAQRPVLAGPVEATAAGNIIVQAIAQREIHDLAEARAIMRDTVKPRRYDPRDATEWREASHRYREIEQ